MMLIEIHKYIAGHRITPYIITKLITHINVRNQV